MYSTIIRALSSKQTDDQDLLSPTLDADQHTTIYSVGALAAAAFFGGGVAVCVMGLLNSQRLRRLGKEWFWVLLALACSVAALAFAIHFFGLEDSQSGREVRMANRGAGFALVGLFYWVHRREYRSMTATGVTAPKPWVPVIAAAVVGFAATAGLMVLTTQVMG
jgi:hypothetical protein